VGYPLNDGLVPSRGSSCAIDVLFEYERRERAALRVDVQAQDIERMALVVGFASYRKVEDELGGE
jgi:hypothetical protein